MENPESFPSAFLSSSFLSLKGDVSMRVSQCSAALNTGEDISPKDQSQPNIMCSMKIILCMALLVAVAISSVSADTGKFSSCCTKVSSAKPKVQIEDFLLQKQDLPCVEAVIFITKEGRILCSKPSLPWVIQKMKEITLRKETSQKNQ